MKEFKIIENALDKIGHGKSGGSTHYKDLAFFENIKPKDPIIWHNTRWFPSKDYPHEECQIITIFRCRKKENRHD